MATSKKQPPTEKWVVLNYETICPTCKKKHVCGTRCQSEKTKCIWVHLEYDEYRDHPYTKTQCISCYNIEFRRKYPEEFDDFSDDDRDYTACGTDCGYCGNCDY